MTVLVLAPLFVGVFLAGGLILWPVAYRAGAAAAGRPTCRQAVVA